MLRCMLRCILHLCRSIPMTMAAIISALHAMGNALLLQKTVFPLLENDSVLMVSRSEEGVACYVPFSCTCSSDSSQSRVHFLILSIKHMLDKAHMDPSIIISTPLPLENLFSFMALSLVWSFVVAIIDRVVMTRDSREVHKGIFHAAMIIVVHTIIIHFIIIICGIHPTVFPLHTLLSAFYVSFNTPQSIHRFVAANYWSSQKQQLVPNEHAKRQQVSQRNSTRLQLHHQLTILGMIIGMVVCAILRVLDHGMQVQRYPIPIIVGATLGSCGGIAVAFILALFGHKTIS